MTRRCVILVVDDERAVEEYIQEFLTKRGYEQVSFTDPVSALQFLSRNLPQIDLILSDVKMPGIDGLELAKRAVALKPDISIILLSAFSETLPDAAALPNVKAVLEKPLLKTDLLQAVDEVISACRRRAAERRGKS